MHSLRIHPAICGSALGGLFLLACVGHAQGPPASGTVHATGQHEVKIEPQRLRLSLNVRAEGANAKSAIESLLAHKERARKELVEMKAEESAITFGRTNLGSSVAGVPVELQPYGSRLLGQLTDGATDSDNLPRIYLATSTLEAEWPLPTTDADALSMLPETLREQVKSRDLLGEKNKAILDSAQQEKLEELQTAMQENYPGVSSDSEQSATVFFVAIVDPETRKQAMKASYERAVVQAEMLASVTDHKLGALQSLRVTETPSIADNVTQSMYQAMYAAYSGGVSETRTNPHPDEVQDTSPSGLTLNLRVDVEFALVK